MSKKEKLDQLLTEWEEAIEIYQGKFKRDGIINETLYDKANKKILFITKEANDPSQGPGDFRVWWKEGIRKNFSKNIALWSHGILHDFPTYESANVKVNLDYAIKSIAFINIKKSGGKGRSSYYETLEHLKFNLKFLHRQISIIQPEIIILGLTWAEHKNILFPDVEWKTNGYGIRLGIYGKITLVDFYHPSARMPSAASYSLLENVLN